MVYHCINTMIQLLRKEGHRVWQFNSRDPVFIQIANRLRGDILGGKYPEDGQIPSVRQIAGEASVNPNTVQRALAMLEGEGLLYSKGTVGRFVTADSGILDAAREKNKRETVKAMLADAYLAGITAEELIKYIKEEATKE